MKPLAVRYASARSTERGFGLIQVLVALALLSFLALAAMQVSDTMLRSVHGAKMSSRAVEMEARVRSAFLSTRALAATRTANPALATCFTTGCSISALEPIEMRDAADQIVVPRGASVADPWVTVSDGGIPCALGPPECRWKAQVQMRAVCATYPCAADSFQLRYILSWNADVPGPKFVMKDRVVDLTIAKDQFLAPAPGAQCPVGQEMFGVNLDGSAKCRVTVSALECAVGQEMFGINPDGSPKCRPSAGLCPAGQYRLGPNCHSVCRRYDAKLQVRGNSGGSITLTCPAGCYVSGRGYSGTSMSCVWGSRDSTVTLSCKNVNSGTLDADHVWVDCAPL